MISSADTASTCSGSGWVSTPEAEFAHSRSTSQATSSFHDIGDVGNMANLGYVQAPTESPVMAVYPNAQPQMMSPHGSMQPMMSMSVVMPHCDESWSETGHGDELDTMPILEAQTLSPSGLRNMEESFSGAGGVLSSMPPMPVGKLPGLPCKEPPPPPPGVPTVPRMPQHPASNMAMVQSPMHRPAQMSSPSLNLPINANGNCVQPMQCSNGMPVPFVGYMSDGNCQYALVPVPVQQYNNGTGYAVSPTCNGTPQARFPAMDQQYWGPYEEYQQQSSCPVSPSYHSEQRWAVPYETVHMGAPVSPCGGGSTQWW